MNPVYRDGKIHVCAHQCKTCIFRPGNLMQLRRGRVKQMVRDATANDSCITCHSTLGGDEACCRGFFDLKASASLRLGVAMNVIEFQEIE